MREWLLRIQQWLHIRCPECAAPTFMVRSGRRFGLAHTEPRYRKCTRCHWHGR